MFDDTQTVVAALGFIFPAHVVDAGKLKRYAAGLHSSARTISARLGSQVYPFGGASG
jgi:hypothetical protein